MTGCSSEWSPADQRLRSDSSSPVYWITQVKRYCAEVRVLKSRLVFANTAMTVSKSTVSLTCDYGSRFR